MSADAWLEDLLPTKWSRRLAIATIALATGAFGLPSLLPASYLPASEEQQFLLRLTLLLASGLAGTFAVLVSVQCYVVELTHQPSTWPARHALAMVAALACLGALSFVVPSSYLSGSVERAFAVGMAFLALAIVGTLVVLFYALRNAKRIEKRVNRSFWEAGP